MKHFIIGFIACFIALFLLASFGAWEINPALWNKEFRCFFAFIATLLSVLMGGINLSSK